MSRSRHRLAVSFVLALSTVTSSAFASELSSEAPRFARPPAATDLAPTIGTDHHTANAPVAAPVIDRAAVRAKLAANRRANLARFRAYRVAGVYPSNVYTTGALNVWRDGDNHLCAAATIIHASGEVALVEQIAEANNFIRLADVSDGPLMDWILTSGLTQAELVDIQKPFMGVSPRPQLEPATEPMLVDAELRSAETARLAKLYRQIEARLVKHQKQSLERAVDRLMAKPALAARLLAS